MGIMGGGLLLRAPIATRPGSSSEGEMRVANRKKGDYNRLKTGLIYSRTLKMDDYAQMLKRTIEKARSMLYTFHNPRNFCAVYLDILWLLAALLSTTTHLAINNL